LSSIRKYVFLPTENNKPPFYTLYQNSVPSNVISGIVKHVEIFIFICLKYKAKKLKIYRKLTMPNFLEWIFLVSIFYPLMLHSNSLTLRYFYLIYFMYP